MKKLLFVLLPVILLMIIPHAYAMEYIPYLGFTLPKNPQICILNNTNEAKYYNVTQTAINLWTILLDGYTNSHNWDIKLKITDNEHKVNCDIVFNYDLETHDWSQDGGKIFGKPQLWRELGVTTVDPKLSFIEIKIHTLYRNNSEILPVITHEFGHGMGLGHRMGNTGTSMVAAFLSYDIMFPWMKKGEWITDDDIKALINLYGTQGWHDGFKIPNSYIITHPTKIVVYCNGQNSTNGLCYNYFSP